MKIRMAIRISARKASHSGFKLSNSRMLVTHIMAKYVSFFHQASIIP